MRFTKTPEELAARRALVSALIASGNVMNDAARTAKRKAQKRFDELEYKAELIISGLQAPARRQDRLAAITTPKVVSEAPAEATTLLAEGTKYDNLALAADKVLQDILNS
jgi:hypothetical protein